MILVHGHRGARARRPENTLPAFEYAISLGVDFLELDVAVTSDDAVVVSHDPHIGGRAIRDLTLAQVREYDCGSTKNPDFPDQEPVPGARIPVLDQVFELGLGNSVGFNVEVKSFPDHPELTPEPGEFARLVLHAIEKRGLARRVIVQSFDSRALRAMEALDPAIPRGALLEELREWEEVQAEFNATLICPEQHLVTAESVAWAHRAGLKVVPWTANRAEDWERLTRCGVDAIITDDPGVLIGWLKKTGARAG